MNQLALAMDYLEDIHLITDHADCKGTIPKRLRLIVLSTWNGALKTARDSFNIAITVANNLTIFKEPLQTSLVHNFQTLYSASNSMYKGCALLTSKLTFNYSLSWWNGVSWSASFTHELDVLSLILYSLVQQASRGIHSPNLQANLKIVHIMLLLMRVCITNIVIPVMHNSLNLPHSGKWCKNKFLIFDTMRSNSDIVVSILLITMLINMTPHKSHVACKAFNPCEF